MPTPASGLMSPGTSQAAEHRPGMRGELRVLHWNIHSWRDTDGEPNPAAVVDVIREHMPDAFSLVEVDESWGMPSVLADVAAECGYAWIFGPSFESGTDATAGGFGNALLTKIPIAAVQQWRLFSPPRPYDGTEPSEPRSLIIARLIFSGVPLWLGSTHLPANDPGDRAAAALRLQGLARRLTAPWIICGDFNAPPSACFTDDGTVVVSPDPVQPTYPATHPTAPIDYCIAAPGTLLQSAVLQAGGSDHLPLLTTVSSLGAGAA
jgi:endonuclease/exonuclease/phosphatase family metal-dependent hydrolase